MQKYNKTLVALTSLVLTLANQLNGSSHVVQLVISVAGVLGVFLVPNLEAGVEAVASDVEAANKG